MIVDVVMPKMGESLQEGTIIKWLKIEGEAVERDEMILEISTDKVDTEIPAPVAGILSKILFKENETINVGVKIAEIETANGQSAPVEVKEIIVKAAPIVTPEVKESVSVADTIVTSGSEIFDVVMPKMGESLQEGTIIKWLKQVGEKVERDEMILEISTDKVDTEVPSPVSGILFEILTKENETVEVGTVIARVSSGSQAMPPQSSAKADAKDSNIIESVQVVPINTASTAVVTGTTVIPSKSGDKFFSPLVRSIATDNGITLEELSAIDGSGIDARVTKDDLIKYIELKKSKPIQVQAQPAVSVSPKLEPQRFIPATPSPSMPVSPKPHAIPAGDDIEVIPMDRIRQLIAEHMVYSKQTSAHVTSVAEADVTQIVRLRDKLKEEFFKKEGIKLTYTPFFARAAVEALAAFPMVNISVDGKNILRHKRIHLGIATALNDGNLIVPVIKNAEALNITGLARGINDLSTRARTRKLNPDDIQGGTFTITNVGTFGTLFGTPVINQPQTAIMGIGAIQKRAVVKELDGEDVIVVRSMAYVSLTYDHRAIDGMLAGQCLAAIVKSLESMNENTVKL